MTTRTTHRSKTGAKRYLVHGSDGRIKDNQSYRKAHRRDLATKSEAELTWHRWAIVCTKGQRFGAVENTVNNRALAREFCAQLRDIYGGTWITARCTITLHEPKRKARK